MRIRLVLVALGLATALHAQNNGPITITIDAAANRHPINPNIYGVSFASIDDLRSLQSPLNREGGNGETRYNWQANATNRASDGFFESIGESSATPGEHADTFIDTSKAGGAEPMITIPIMGWVARLGPDRSGLNSFSVAKYGPQQSTDPQMPDAGNGTRPDGSLIVNNDPNDANLPVDATFQQAWVQHLVSRWGLAANGGVRYYVLDNEHSLWQSTHRDVHPAGATMDEVFSKMMNSAQSIKSVDPGALVAGPEEWGWGGYFSSGYDQQWDAAHGPSDSPDRAAHGNADYLPWLLDQFRAYDTMHGVRLLDLFTVHYYPQGGEFSDNTSIQMQLLRNRSTRSLWDASYVDASWIANKVQLIPLLHSWVDEHYPGTKIGITEYNWGAESHINGATAQADILGIFGREGLDLATRFMTPSFFSPVYKAMQMYLRGFGDISVKTSSPDPDNLSAFAAVRSADQALTVMLVSKTLEGDTATTIDVSNFDTRGRVQIWQLTAENLITYLGDVALSGTSFHMILPPQSITMAVFLGPSGQVTGPALALSGPPTLTDGLFAFSGTASPDVTSISYFLSGATRGSGNVSGTTSWNATLKLNPGNTIIEFSARGASLDETSLSIIFEVAPRKYRLVRAASELRTSPERYFTGPLRQ